MTGRERILTVLSGGIPDRVPVSFFVQEEFLSLLYPGRKTDRVRDAVACARYFDFDIMTRSKVFTTPYFLQKSFPNWEVTFKNYREAGNYYESYEIETPLKILKQVEAGPDVGDRVGGLHLATREYLIKDPTDLEAFVKYVPAVDKQTIAEMREYCRWSKTLVGATGISVPWGMGGVFNQAATFRDIAELLTDPYFQPEFYELYLTKLADLSAAFNRELAAANGDAVGIQGNIANAAMVGPNFFDSYIMPYERRVVEAIHEAGSFTVYHNCGKAEVLQESYVAMGVSAWETVAEAPQGDNSLAKAKQSVGARLTLIGNLDQVHFLKTATPAEVGERVAETVRIGKVGGRYIFAGSDFLERGTPLENVRAAVQATRESGRY